MKIHPSFIAAACSLVLTGAAVAGDATTGKSLQEILEALDPPAKQGGTRGGAAAAADRSAHPEPRIGVPIEFAYDSDAISPGSMQQLATIAGALADPRLQRARIRIEGHTDEIGSSEYNLRLSRRRAGAVRRALIEGFSVSPQRLEAVGYGESRPLPEVSQATEEGRARNRRVELVRLAGVVESGAEEPGGPPSVDVAEPQGPVVVDVWYHDGAGARRLEPGASLRSHDRYRVRFTAAERRHVYVFKINSANMVENLFPNRELSADANPVAPRRSYVVPGADGWLELDTMRGREQIVAFASEGELKDPRAMVYDLTVRAPGAPVPGYGPDGLFTVRFDFEHR
jgi:outer membrane protein OmpA-like peptidoglycan-associated protein